MRNRSIKTGVTWCILVGALLTPMVCAQDCLTFVGRWGHGPTRAVVASGGYAYFGSGTVLVVADVSNPLSPVVIGEITLPDFVEEIAYSNGMVYVANRWAGFRIVDVSTPSNPHEVGSILTYVWAESVAVYGHHAFVLDIGSGLHVIDVEDPTSPVDVGLIGITLQRYGHDVAASGATVFLTKGNYLYIIDVDNPSVPVEITHLYSQFTSTVNAWGDFAYVGGYDGSFKVIDVSDPTTPFIAGEIDTLDPVWDIDVVEDLVVLANSFSGTTILDVSDPSASTQTSNYMPSETDSVLGVSWFDGHVFAADRSEGLRVLDVSQPTTPIEVGFVDTPAPTQRVTVIDDHAFVTDKYEGLRIIDVNTPENPNEIGHLGLLGETWGVAVAEDLAYVANGESGLRVIDVSDVSAPTGVGLVDTPGEARGVSISNSLVFVADKDEGIRIIDVSLPHAPVEIGSIDTPGWASEVVVREGLAYVADTSGLRIIDVGTPSVPVELGSCEAIGSPYDVAVAKDFAYLASGLYGLKIVNISDPTAPFYVGGWSNTQAIQNEAHAVAVSGGLVYLADGHNGVYVIDVSDPTAPVEVAAYERVEYAEDIFLYRNHVFFAEQENGMAILSDYATLFFDGFETGDCSDWTSVVGEQKKSSMLRKEPLPEGN